MTKRESFASIKAILNEMGHEEFNAFLDHEVELLGRKRSGASKPTKRQVANDGIKGQIADVLLKAEEGGMTAGEVTAAIADPDATPNRVVALLGQMKKAGIVIREEVKGKARFKLA